ncbi:SGNH/GDSL hydrolase family protein [Pseudarthrobacter sp. LMD1-1-1.1]|uniref:SGNH/GDSL hydrolase family protein n=1 Tax=Pseudarthrobacter sp. LMD1-1-1.1 TaxID=3135242 RepID=UPI003421128C
MVVFGDSTGNDSDEFVFLLAKQMSDHYNRPVLMHRWINSAYTAPLTIGAGGNAPINIWNGSVPGQTGDYALTNLAKMAPDGLAVDLVMMNYGHNYKGVWNAEQTTLKLAQAVDDKLGAKAMLYMLQNPENPEADNSAAVVNLFRNLTKDSGYEAVDVYAAFKAKGDIAPLLVDNIHPNPAGSKVWADAVAPKLIR